MSTMENTTREQEQKGSKRPLQSETSEEVHSPNDWEHANLGDDERRQKFLRLMGAHKKEHHGRIVIGDTSSHHGRTDIETDSVNRQLEAQYETGLQHKLTGAARHHVGLGFQPETPKDSKPSQEEGTEPAQGDGTAPEKETEVEQVTSDTKEKTVEDTQEKHDDHKQSEQTSLKKEEQDNTDSSDKNDGNEKGGDKSPTVLGFVKASR